MNHPINRTRRSHTSPRMRQCRLSPFPKATVANVAFIVFLCVSSWLYSTLWEIKQDGTGNFTTIQQGINAATHSDTILAYPGTYFENLVILEKYITLGSLYLTTGDESYILQTILDGNHISSVIRVEDIPIYNEVIISGLIIQNGVGFTYSSTNNYYEKRGGGLYIIDSNILLKKCIIHNNYSWMGGGIYIRGNADIVLIGNTIRYNKAFYKCGGLYLSSGANAEFNQNILNNIYLNYSGVASDIFISNLSPFQEIILDTFTVANPSEGYYFIYPSSGGAGSPQPGLFSTNIQHGYIEQVNQDLYVSPYGDNDNSGVSLNDPLQSISFALTKIYSDSLNHKAIHILDGVYSPSLNNQFFPLHIKSYVDLIGESRDNTILDAEFYFGHIYAYDPQKNYKIENITFINSLYQSNFKIGENTNVEINNIKITNSENIGQISRTGIFANFSDMNLKNIIVENNFCQGCVYLYSPKYGTELNIHNCIFLNNESPEASCLPVFAYRTTVLEDSLIVNIINSQITNNFSSCYEWLPATSGIHIMFNTKLNLINSTIGNNACLFPGAAIQLDYYSTANIINSIVYGNVPYNLCLNGGDGPNSLTAYNSLIEGGIESIYQIGTNYINWNYETMLDENPLWLGAGYEFPYALSANSPCIDMGTLELPCGVELPAYDLAGNPRVMGSAIDMGAYEFPDNPAPIYLQVDNETLFWQIPPGYNPTGYNVYLEGAFQAYVSVFTPQYTFSGLIIGESYTAGVSALYETEETAVIPLQFTYQPVGIEANSHLSPLTSNLSNYPNPFNPSTTISFSLTTEGTENAELVIYNIKGQKVKTLIAAELSSGRVSCTWNGRNDAGKRVASGEYIAVLKVNDKVLAERKMMMIK